MTPISTSGLQQTNLQPKIGGTTTSTTAPTQQNSSFGSMLLQPFIQPFQQAGNFLSGLWNENNPTYKPPVSNAPAPTPTAASSTAAIPQVSAWSNPVVTSHPAATNTSINPITSTPPVSTAPTNLHQGAPTGGGLMNTTGQKAPSGMEWSPNGQLEPITTGQQAGAALTPQINPATNTSGQTNAIIQNLQNIAGQGSAGDATEQALQDQIRNLETSIGLGQGQIANRPEPLSFATGQEAALLAQRNPELQALTNQLAALQANRSASIGAATNAGGLSNQLQGLQQQNQTISPGQSLYNLYSGGLTGQSQLPATSLSPGQGLYSPFTGQQIGGNATLSQLSGGQNGGVLQSLAQQVINGQLTEDQAQGQLPTGVPGAALNQAILSLNPTFNTTQSQYNAQIQGQLPPAAQQAGNMLTNLQNALQNAPALEQTSVPVINSLASLLSGLSGIGGGGTQALTSALTDARAAMANALGAANNSTPSAYDSYVKTLLPDGITMTQLQNSIQQFQNQIQGKLQAYSSPGTTSFSGGSTGGSIYNF